MRQRWMSPMLLRELGYMPWSWLLAFVFNLVMLIIYLELQPAPDFLDLLLLLTLQLMLLVGVTLRFLVALGNAEKQKQELLQQLADGMRRVELAEAAARQAERQWARAEEKRRIFQQLHEDVGYKLLSIAHAGHDARLSGLASSALASLRDAISRANSPETLLGAFLLRLQEEMTLRLAGLGVRLQWSPPVSDAGRVLSPEQHYRLSRIFRELVHNIIRHAHATQVEFSVVREDAGWHFCLADDGAGFEPTQPPGQGIAAVMQWAQELGAHAEWQTQPGAGTRFRLLLPAGSPLFPAKSIS